MAKYIIKRVAMGIFSIFIVATVTFFVMNLVLSLIHISEPTRH